MKTILLLADGFEEIEAIVVIDVLRRLGVPLDLVAIGNTLNVIGAHQITLRAEKLLAAINAANYSCVILPGGMPGAANLRANPNVVRLVQTIHANNGITAAICAAPMVLAQAGLLAGRRFTGYPGFDADFGGSPSGNPAETDGRVITGRGPGASFAFAAAVATALGLGNQVKALYPKMMLTESQF
jgi:4-methyl-5(b-hydroxyethyl)-thiazole monophosphate biosynthesis